MFPSTVDFVVGGKAPSLTTVAPKRPLLAPPKNGFPETKKVPLLPSLADVIPAVQEEEYVRRLEKHLESLERKALERGGGGHNTADKEEKSFEQRLIRAEEEYELGGGGNHDFGGEFDSIVDKMQSGLGAFEFSVDIWSRVIPFLEPIAFFNLFYHSFPAPVSIRILQRTGTRKFWNALEAMTRDFAGDHLRERQPFNLSFMIRKVFDFRFEADRFRDLSLPVGFEPRLLTLEYIPAMLEPQRDSETDDCIIVDMEQVFQTYFPSRRDDV